MHGLKGKSAVGTAKAATEVAGRLCKIADESFDFATRIGPATPESAGAWAEGALYISDTPG